MPWSCWLEPFDSLVVIARLGIRLGLYHVNVATSVVDVGDRIRFSLSYRLLAQAWQEPILSSAVRILGAVPDSVRKIDERSFKR